MGVVDEIEEYDVAVVNRIERAEEESEIDTVQIADAVLLGEMGRNPRDDLSPLTIQPHAIQGFSERPPHSCLVFLAGFRGGLDLRIPPGNVRMDEDAGGTEGRHLESHATAVSDGGLKAWALDVCPLDSLGSLNGQPQVKEEREGAIESLAGR